MNLESELARPQKKKVELENLTDNANSATENAQ